MLRRGTAIAHAQKSSELVIISWVRGRYPEIEDDRRRDGTLIGARTVPNSREDGINSPLEIVGNVERIVILDLGDLGPAPGGKCDVEIFDSGGGRVAGGLESNLDLVSGLGRCGVERERWKALRERERI